MALIFAKDENMQWLKQYAVTSKHIYKEVLATYSLKP